MRGVSVVAMTVSLATFGCSGQEAERRRAEAARAEAARAEAEAARAEVATLRAELEKLRAETAIPAVQKGNLRDPDWRTASWVLEIGGRLVVHVGGKDVDVKRLEELGDRPFRVTQVWLPHNRLVDDAGLARLLGLRQIRYLDLFGTSITDAGLVHVNTLGSLIGLSLRDTPITDAGLAGLRNLPSLRSLDLSGTRTTAAGAEAFRKSHPECQVDRAAK